MAMLTAEELSVFWGGHLGHTVSVCTYMCKKDDKTQKAG